MTVNSEQAARIACSFLTLFYKEFVDDLSSILAMYGDLSCVSCAFNESVGTTSQGKSEIRTHYARLSQLLGQRKVEIRNADFVPSADGGVAVTCSGQLFTRLCRRVFMHSFVLTPTKFRDNTMYIAAECLRFLPEETENLPLNCVIVTPEQYHRSLQQEAAAFPVAAEAPATVQRKERPRRAKTVETEQPAVSVDEIVRIKEKPSAAPVTAVVETKPRKERVPREKTAPRQKTKMVRLVSVPKFIRLSDIRYEAEAFGLVEDLFWYQDTDAIVVFPTPEKAREFISATDFTVRKKVLAKEYHFDE